VLHTAAVGVWLGVVLPAGPVASDTERWRVHWETGHAVSFGLLLLGFGALVLAVLSERYPRDRSLGPVLLKQPRLGLDRRPARPVPGRQGDGAEHRRDRPTSHEVYEVPTGRFR
jgi:hypothetical protein